jgi:hypothetical protein
MPLFSSRDASSYRRDRAQATTILTLTELYYGIGALLGYEWMARYGLSVRMALGIAYSPAAEGSQIGPALDLVSIGYKIW